MGTNYQHTAFIDLKEVPLWCPYVPFRKEALTSRTLSFMDLRFDQYKSRTDILRMVRSIGRVKWWHRLKASGNHALCTSNISHKTMLKSRDLIFLVTMVV